MYNFSSNLGNFYHLKLETGFFGTWIQDWC